MGMQSRPYLQATEAVHAPSGEQRDEASIYVELAKACGISIFGSAIAQKAFEFSRRFDRRKRERRGGLPGIPQEWILNALLRAGGQASYKKLLESPDGLSRPRAEGGNYLSGRIVTEDKKVDLAPTALMEATAELEAAFEAERSDNRMRLITKRSHETHNSWTHNIEEFVSGERETNHLYMHPDDARKAGLGNGDLADVRSKVATVRIPVRLLSDLMPGTVAMPHGWGHQHATGLSVASRTAGVNVNLLAADGPDSIEKISGMANLTGFPVDVFPAAGPRTKESWSGIAEQPPQP